MRNQRGSGLFENITQNFKDEFILKTVTNHCNLRLWSHTLRQILVISAAVVNDKRKLFGTFATDAKLKKILGFGSTFRNVLQ